MGERGSTPDNQVHDDSHQISTVDVWPRSSRTLAVNLITLVAVRMRAFVFSPVFSVNRFTYNGGGHYCNEKANGRGSTSL